MCGFSNWTSTQVTMMWYQANRFSGSSTAQSWRCSFFWGGQTRCTRWQKIKILYQQNVGYTDQNPLNKSSNESELRWFCYEMVMSNSIWLDISKVFLLILYRICRIHNSQQQPALHVCLQWPGGETRDRASAKSKDAHGRAFAGANRSGCIPVVIELLILGGIKQYKCW